MATDPTSEISELIATLASVEAVLDPDAMRKEADSLRERSLDPTLWEDQEQAQEVTRRLSYLDAELARLDALHSRLDDTAVMFELAESEQDEPTRDRRRAGARRAAQGDRPAGDQDPAERRVRRPRGPDQHQRRCRRSGRGRLDRGPAADLPALGRAARLLDRGLRHLLRRRGRDQVDDVRDQGAVCLRDPARRARHAPDGAHLQVRQPGPPSDLVRHGRRAAGRAAGRPHRHPGRRDADRRLPLQRARRPGRQHHRLRRPDHAPADRHRGVLPERAQPDPEQGHRHGGPAVQAAGAQARGAGRQDERAARATGAAAGAPRSATTSCTRTRTSRTSGPATRPATRPPSWTARSTSSSRPRSAGSAPRGCKHPGACRSCPEPPRRRRA